jgi:hypothetical protein
MAMDVDDFNALSTDHYLTEPRDRSRGGRLGGRNADQFAAHHQGPCRTGYGLDEFPAIAHSILLDIRVARCALSQQLYSPRADSLAAKP